MKFISNTSAPLSNGVCTLMNLFQLPNRNTSIYTGIKKPQ